MPYKLRGMRPINVLSLFDGMGCAWIALRQTIPDWYKWGCSETQQYKMLGNGWCVDVIVHILSFMDKNRFN